MVIIIDFCASNMKPIQEIFPLLDEPRKVVVTMHQKPDPDAMGSSLALSHFLRQLGHEVTVISPTNWPEFLNWMPGCKDVLDYELNREKSNAFVEKADWIFCLDFNAIYRAKNLAPRIEKSGAIKILIDHHEQPQIESFEYGVSSVSKSSTSEMVYDFMVDSGHRDLINVSIAECLYAGIIGDTGSFRFPGAAAARHNRRCS